MQQISPLGALHAQFVSACAGHALNFNMITHECRVDATSARAADDAPALDAWTAQVYRGNTFGDFFDAMGNATGKPVLLTEYGVDAYHDVCGQTRHSCHMMTP